MCVCVCVCLSVSLCVFVCLYVCVCVEKHTSASMVHDKLQIELSAGAPQNFRHLVGVISRVADFTSGVAY